MTTEPWYDSSVVGWTQLLLNSYRHWLKNELVDRTGDPLHQARALFTARFVVVSHHRESEPILNYGNQVALDLWEMPWEQFVKTPSRLTAEIVNQSERDRMLQRAKLDGYFDNYTGVRISSTGRRFTIEQAVIWNVIDSTGSPVGQAATFSQWS